MTWMKVDDGLYDHPKMFDAPDCAVALWTRAGSWAARNLTDGFVPAGMARRLCDDPDRAVDELVARGLWERAEGGFRFHDWLDYNRSRDQVLTERARDAEKKAKARAALAEKRRSGRSSRPAGTPGRTGAGTPRRTSVGSPGLPAPGSLPSSGNRVPGGRGAERPPVPAAVLEARERYQRPPSAAGLAAARATLDAKVPRSKRPPGRGRGGSATQPPLVASVDLGEPVRSAS